MSEVRSGRRPRWVPRGLTVPRRLRVPAVVIAVVAAVAAGMAARPEPVVRTEDLRLPGVPEAGRPVELDTRIYRPPTGSGPCGTRTPTGSSRVSPRRRGAPAS